VNPNALQFEQFLPQARQIALKRRLRRDRGSFEGARWLMRWLMLWLTLSLHRFPAREGGWQKQRGEALTRVGGYSFEQLAQVA